MVSKKLFFLLILLLPTQLGLHFWPPWSSIFGIRVDYLSPTIYLTDILVVGILISWGLQNRNNFQFSKLFICLFIYLFITSIFIAQNPGAAFYKLAKLVELVLLGFYVYHAKPLDTIRYPLIIAIFYSSVLAWLQFFNQGTISGLFWWLGERSFSQSTPGIALFEINGQEFLRPYATFPHPNVLAGFLLTVLVFLFYQKNKIHKIIFYPVFLLSSSALILSFSHTVFIVTSVILITMGFTSRKPKMQNILWKVFAAVTVFSFMFSMLPPELFAQQEIKERIELARAAREMFFDYPLTGVGLNNFIPRIPEYSIIPSTVWLLQPVHNIFLLVLSETGIIGFLFFGWFLFQMIKKLSTINYKLSIIFLAILLTGVFDHYWLTLQQTQVLLVIMLGFFCSPKRQRSLVK